MPLASGGLYPERNFVKYCFETTTNFDILISVLHHRNQHLSPSLQIRGDTICFEKLIWLKDFTRSLVILSQVRTCNFSDYIPVPYTCAPCICWFGQKVKNCPLLWDATRLYLLPHRTIVWYLLGEGPHSNQLHFYHLVINTMTTTSVEILCTILLHSLETTYSSSK